MSERKNPRYFYGVMTSSKSDSAVVLAAIFVLLLFVFITGCTKSKWYDPLIGDPLKASIVSTVPSNQASSVFVDPVVSVTYSNDVDPSTISSTAISLKKGTTEITGTVTLSGNTASFFPEADLSSESEYTATVKTTPKSSTDFSAAHEYSWKFTTGKSHRVDSLSVVSVSPTDKATAVAANSPLIVNFNEDLTASMMKSVTISLKKGSSTINGVVSFTGKTATFQPSEVLVAGTVYSGKVLIGSAQNGNNAVRTFAWSFTTSGTAPDLTPPVIGSVIPANNAVSVSTGTAVSVTFSEAMNPSTISASTFLLKQGTTAIAGTVAYTGTTATFTPSAALTGNTLYTGTITTGVKDLAGNALAAAYTWSFKTATVIDNTPPTIISVVPVNASSTASTTTKISATFSEAMNAATINSSSFTLRQGSTAVTGTVAYSGVTATFTPSAALTAGTLFTATISTSATDAAGNALASNYAWSFTTASSADVTPPTVSSVVPASGASAIAVSSKVTATFSESMDATTITASTFTLKQGSTTVAGTVTYSGTTATFSPAAALSGNTVYTAAVTTGVKDLSGNAMAAAYTWSFTTATPADVTPPAVTSVVPASGASSVAVNSNVTATFSEAMTSSTITGTTFTVKQGGNLVAGNVTYSGTTATFTPSAALTGNTVYTCTITTGVRDLAGNAMVSAYTWSFTTVATVTGKSFASDVMPILNICNTCHTHGWTPSTVASTFYANLLSAGYINTTTPTSGKIYNKLSGGHPPGSTVTAAQVTTILTWITEGSKNN